MYFSISETQEIKDSKRPSYVAYSINTNGLFHCLLRYKQLYNFHEQLKKEFGTNNLPCFPPKKLLPLNQSEIEERRSLLEKYIQIISQDERISKSEYFNEFFLLAQRETYNIPENTVNLDVYLMNSHRINVEVSSNDKSSIVLEKISRSLQLSTNYHPYFSLFLIKMTNEGLVLFRKMMDFESPYLTVKNINNIQNNYQLVVRKNYWDISFDEFLLNDRIALNLLYAEAYNNVETGWINPSNDVKKQLIILQNRGSKREFVELCQTLKYYGYIQFEPCICDYPEPNTEVQIYAGGKELVFKELNKDNPLEYNFKVTRIRCWRLSGLHTGENNLQSINMVKNMKLELSFEYLFSKDNLKWIAIKSDQGILISLCLKGIVEELLTKRKGPLIKSDTRRDAWSYMKRDGSSKQIVISKSISSDTFFNCDHKYLKKSNSLNENPMKSLSTMENDAFNGIGDEDL